MPGRLVTLEVDILKFTSNFHQIRKLLQPTTKFMAVVKGNAYGHGTVSIAKKAVELGADYLGVVCLYEARQIRRAGITVPVLLLNYTDVSSIDEAVSLECAITVMDEDVLSEISKQSEKQNKHTNIHIKIDTGMHRLGLPPEEGLQLISKVKLYSHVTLEGIFTHFASADDPDLTFACEQLAVFTAFLEKIQTKPPLIHAANSAATLRLPESHFTMVRPGKILYGPLPKESYELPFISKSIITLKTQIAQIRRIGKGESVGYARAFIAEREMMIATLPVGYADGFRRSPNFGEVLVRGKKVPLVGRVSMDQSSIDISSVPDAKVSDEVVLIGKQGIEEITTEEVADRLGTINYEVVTQFTERVERVYTNT